MNPYNNSFKIKVSPVTTTQILLRRALIKQMHNKNINQIEVTSLCQQANVARNTFYSHYQNIDDLLNEIENTIVSDLFNINLDIMDSTIEEANELNFYQKTLDYVSENKTELNVLLQIQPSIRFLKKMKDSIKYQLVERMKHTHRQQSDLKLDIAASATVSSLIYSLDYQNEVTLQEASELISEVLKHF